MSSWVSLRGASVLDGYGKNPLCTKKLCMAPHTYTPPIPLAQRGPYRRERDNLAAKSADLDGAP